MRLLVRLWWRLVRFGFRLLYNELAFAYDFISSVVSLGGWRCWQRTALDYLPLREQGRLLELAHGTGSFHADLLTAGYDVVAVDISPYMGSIARRKLIRKGHVPGLIQARAQELPFDDSTFSAVVVTFPTRFIFEKETLAECWRVVDEDGRLVAVLSGMLRGGGLVQRGLELLYRVTGQRMEQADSGKLLEDVIERCRQHGFEARFVTENCGGSDVLLLIAEKVILPN